MGPRAILAVAVCCALALPAAAQQADHFPAQQDFSVTYQERGETGGEGRILLKTRGLPHRTSVLLKLQLDEDEIPASWKRYTVDKNGMLSAQMGPFQQALLPGTYAVEFSVDRRQQDVTLDDFFSRWSRDAKQSYQWPYRPAEEPKARAEFRGKLIDLLNSAEKLLDATLQAGDGYRNGTHFQRSGRFDKVAFLKWADEAARTISGAQQRIRGLEDAYLAPYWPQQVRFDIPNLLLNLRFVVIDYTIYPIHRRENLSVARRFQPMAGMMFKPSRASATSKVRSLKREIIKTLLAQQGPDLLTLIPPPANRPPGFDVVKLEGVLAALVQTNPGGTAKPGDAEVKQLAARLGLSLPREHLQELALLAVAPEGKGEAVELYLMRFKREFYGTLIVQQLAKQREEGRFHGRMAQREDLVAVTTTGAKSPSHRGAIGQLHAFLVGQRQFVER